MSATANAPKQNLKKKVVALKDHIFLNRARYAALATLAGCTVLQLRNAAEWNQFLKDHDLFDKYYDDADDNDDQPAIEN